MSPPRRLSVTPSSSLVDTKVAIRATGLQANSPVTIRSVCALETRNGQVKFEGHAQYIADDRGVVSVPDQMSLGGTYAGEEPMGLFWSMHPLPGQRSGVRFMVRDATKPVTVNLSMYSGHLDTEALQTAEPETTTTAERLYMGKDVEKITVHNGRLRGSLFKPKGTGPFPGVIDMFGDVSGLVEFRAAMLASRGFACYALPYFNYEDLPSSAFDLELEYFKEAIDWLSGQPFVRPGGVGMVSLSLGGQFALATVSYFPEKVKAVVCINACHAQITFPFKVNGKESPWIMFRYDREFKPSATVEGAVVLRDSWDDVYNVREDHCAIYKLENAPDCQFLFIAGESDSVCDSCYFAQEAMKRLEKRGHHNYQLLSYPNAGHLIEVPYTPTAEAFFTHDFGLLENGGTTAGNAKAMEDSWPKIIRFLHAYCGRGTSRL